MALLVRARSLFGEAANRNGARGLLSSSQNLLVNGEVRGMVVCEGRVEIGASGVVHGHILADEVVVNGLATGGVVVALQQIKVPGGGHVDSRIYAGRLDVEKSVDLSCDLEIGAIERLVGNADLSDIEGRIRWLQAFTEEPSGDALPERVDPAPRSPAAAGELPVDFLPVGPQNPSSADGREWLW